jgi:nucleoside-triphosphatase THEP1
MADKKIILLTGPVQTGKTTLLYNWVKTKSAVAGVLTPIKDGSRFFYTPHNESWLPMEANDDEDKLLVGRFVFSKQNFESISNQLLLWLQQPQWQYIIIDEIGPLELKQQLGFYKVLQQAAAANFTATLIIVVRENLLTAVQEIFTKPNFAVQVCSVQNFHLHC